MSHLETIIGWVDGSPEGMERLGLIAAELGNKVEKEGIEMSLITMGIAINECIRHIKGLEHNIQENS